MNVTKTAFSKEDREELARLVKEASKPSPNVVIRGVNLGRKEDIELMQVRHEDVNGTRYYIYAEKFNGATHKIFFQTEDEAKKEFQAVLTQFGLKFD